MRVLCTYLFMALLGAAFAQGGSQAHIRLADKFYNEMAYAQAVEEYQQAADQGAVNEHVTSRLGECYLRLNQPQRAEYWYSTVVKFLNCSPENFFYYAEALKSTGRYDEAERWMDKYLNAVNATGNKKSNVSDFARKFAYDTERYQVQLLSINTPYSDFAPAWSGSEKLIFASTRKEKVGLVRKAAINGQPFLDLYEADIMPSGDLTGVQMLGGSINTKYHEGSVSASADGNTLYFTRNDLLKGKSNKSKAGVHHLNIYQASRNGNAWDNIVPFDYNEVEFSVGHPSVSANGKYLFFASDMPGGEGGSDIYFCEFVDGVWAEPKNLGKGINTSRDEMFPFIASDGTLYFSSNGQPGLGGLDTYAAPKQVDGSYDLAINMGAPVNSARDDFGLIIDPTSGKGYFSSNRPGGKGDDDIYFFEQLSELTDRFLCTGLVVEEGLKDVLEGVDVILMTLDGEEVARDKTDPDGKFAFPIIENNDYKVLVKANGKFDAVQHFNSHNIERQQIVSCYFELMEEEGVVVNGVARSNDGALIEDMNVTVVDLTTFETNTSKTGPGGDFMMRVKPDAKYEVLFEKRGYFSMSVPCSSKGIDKGLIDLNAIRPLLFDVAEVGKPILVKGVKWYGSEMGLSGASKSAVDLLAEKLMVNPAMIVEIGVHSDARQDASTSTALTKARAKVVKDYLVLYGIRDDRIKDKGYGSTRLINRCIPGAQCTAEQHMENVRLEYIVTGYLQ